MHRINCVNNSLYSLEGCPSDVYNFDFSDNHLLSLKNAPSKVGGNFLCYGNRLIDLIGGPNEVGERFDCRNNKLTSLDGSPSEVGMYFNCSDNKLTNLNGCPSEVGGDFICRNNKLKDLDISTIIGGNLLVDGNEIDYMNYSFYGEVNGQIDVGQHNPVIGSGGHGIGIVGGQRRR